MKKKIQQEWHSLFKQHTASNLSIAEFCKKRGIAQSSFYKQKSVLTTQAKNHFPATFIKATLPSSHRTSSAIKIQHQKTQLQIPETISALWLAEFVKALT